MCVCVHVCVCACVCIRVCACMCLCVCMCVTGVKASFQAEVTFKLRQKWSRDQAGERQGTKCSRQGAGVCEGPQESGHMEGHPCHVLATEGSSVWLALRVACVGGEG